ncbi:hypothetical protein [Piscibacillus halophilus]|uniref:Uncharacterized protein n=2 Tax=Piscibacillus halophilus TaxID=571933 RepID=A0A1H9EAH7_9BACI|nr:hypothetical protein [Piscibacillus halophilus]SEQ22700.1 hypothetical protein SAMN05216362_10910 [Piscibacillus halophilus]
MTKHTDGEIKNHDFWFPGRCVGGFSLILGPVFLFIGQLLRIDYDFFFTSQLAAFQEEPTRMAILYGFVNAGLICLWPGILTLVRLIGVKCPRLALWGGILTMLGLFSRMYHAGVDNLSYWLVQFQGLDIATKAVGDSYAYNYQGFYVISTVLFSVMVGWFVLAVGAYRSGTLNLFYSILLGLMGIHYSGVLKGTTWSSMAIITGLCIALIPLGFKVLKDGPMPSLQTVIKWVVILALLGGIFFFIGQNA